MGPSDTGQALQEANKNRKNQTNNNNTQYRQSVKLGKLIDKAYFKMFVYMYFYD